MFDLVVSAFQQFRGPVTNQRSELMQLLLLLQLLLMLLLLVTRDLV